MELRERPGQPSWAIARRWFATPDLDLALVLLLLIGFNAPYLASRIVPIHDTFYNFANFHIFYSELFFHGDLAHWYPYGTYGVQSDYEQIIALSPASYLAGLVGALLRLPDALLLFKLAVIAEQIAFVFGVYLLSRRLFPTRATTLILCVAAAGSTVWYAQQWWDMRIYYLLPLVLYFLSSFLEGRRPEHLWLAGITGVAWALGIFPYVIALWVLVLLIVVAVSARDHRRTLALLVTPSRANLLALGLFLAVASAYIYFVLHSLDHTILGAPLRSPITGRVDPEVFRTYGGNANLVVVACTFLFGWPLQLPWGTRIDNSVYIGLLPFLGFALAVARERARFFLGLTAAAVALMWLSVGGAFTRIAYDLPGFSYYRHVGLVYGLVKVLILIASGYGLERIWAHGRLRLSNPVLVLVAFALFFEVVTALLGLFRGPNPSRWVEAWGTHALLRLFVYGTLIALSQRFFGSLKSALVVAVAVDLMVFQLAFYELRVSKVRNVDLLEAVQVREPSYEAERQEPADRHLEQTRSGARGPSQVAFDLATRPDSKWINSYVYQFSNIDPCRSQFRVDTRLSGAARLLSLERSQGLHLDPILGCGAARLRLVSGAQVVDTAQEAQEAVKATARSGVQARTVIQLPEGVARPLGAEGGGSAAGRVTVTRFTLGELAADVDVQTTGGAWLVYADAYHPGWHATVNGRATPVAQANLAFKAVWVPPGPSTVRLWFRYGTSYYLSYAIACLGVAFAAGLLVWVGARSCGLGRRPHGGSSSSD